MKKTYINPTITVVKIATQQMIAVSLPQGAEGKNSEWGARDFDFDDEEEY